MDENQTGPTKQVLDRLIGGPSQYAPQHLAPLPARPCPCCGYCPHCGRGGYQSQRPWYQYYPPYSYPVVYC